MATKKSNVPVEMTLEEMTNYAFSTMTDMGDKIREVVENAEGTLREHTQRMQTLSEIANTIDCMDKPEVPEAIKSIKAAFRENQRKNLSRADRRSNAVEALQIVIDTANEWIENNQPSEDNGSTEDENEEKQNQIDDIQQFIEDVSQLRDEADGIEFPGAYS
jgi:hypothetical protein